MPIYKKNYWLKIGGQIMQNFIQTIINYWKWILPGVTVLIAIAAFLIRKGFLKKIKLSGVELVFSKPDTSYKHKLDKHKLTNNTANNIKPEPLQFFDRSDRPKFAGHFEMLSHKANRIVLIGMGLTILDRSSFFLELIDRISKGECSLEIYLANPFSPAIETRLIEEELGEEMKPPIGKKGIISRIETILDVQKEKKLCNASNFSFKLFSNYLTLALLIIDDEYFSYTYGCARLGNFSPVVCYTKTNPAHKPMIEFFGEQHKRIKMLAIDAQLVYDLHKGIKVKRENLLPFAVYFVPEETSALYEFGIDVLGYDIRRNHSKKSEWAIYVGEAFNFGFHLTIADGLYFSHQHEIKLLSKEIELLAQEFKPFRLTFKIQARFPNESSIALVCQDDSGTLEALHHELVFRCYRRAVASNYSLGIAKIDRDQNEIRSKLMIQRYQAPYILNQFKPHFTLLTKVPFDQMEQITQKIKAFFEQKVPKSHIDITNLSLMTRPKIDSESPWQIKDEIKLKLR